MPMRRYVEQAIAEGCDTEPGDVAAQQLALAYAEQIDQGEPLAVLGPKLLATLDALRLTPRSRPVADTGPLNHGTGPLDELRQRRALRQQQAGAD